MTQVEVLRCLAFSLVAGFGFGIGVALVFWIIEALEERSEGEWQ